MGFYMNHKKSMKEEQGRKESTIMEVLLELANEFNMSVEQMDELLNTAEYFDPNEKENY